MFKSAGEALRQMTRPQFRVEMALASRRAVGVALGSRAASWNPCAHAVTSSAVAPPLNKCPLFAPHRVKRAPHRSMRAFHVPSGRPTAHSVTLVAQ